MLKDIFLKLRNIKTLAQNILDLEKDSVTYAEVADRCAKRAGDFDISKMVDGYVNVYNSLNEKDH
ncbi:MAG: hypothetical protein HDS67_03245 [Bacteroidales bacterium]|nr:hypothetical protein [Bacteroidales bacterium]